MAIEEEKKYTTLSLSTGVKADLEQLLYSSGKKSSYDKLIRELIEKARKYDERIKKRIEGI